MPYMGECEVVLFQKLLIGAFPLWAEDLVSLTDLFFDVEWIIPAEQPSCPAYSESRLCSIYDQRPVACRNFPLIDSSGKLHEFCPNRAVFAKGTFLMPPFCDKLEKFRTFLKTLYEQKGEKAVKCFFLQDDDIGQMPLLYNELWCLVLTISGMDVHRAIEGQRTLLRALQYKGLNNVTVLIPHTEYCITGEIDGLLINLEYLSARIEQEALMEHCYKVLSMIDLA